MDDLNKKYNGHRVKSADREGVGINGDISKLVDVDLMPLRVEHCNSNLTIEIN